MIKDYTVLDGMISNQSAVLKAAYDRGYTHGIADGIEKSVQEINKKDRKDYNKGYLDGYNAGVQAVLDGKVVVNNRNSKIRMLFSRKN